MGILGIGGGGGLFGIASQLAIAAATGGTSLIAQMAVKIATEVASQVIQQLGQQLGLPQPMIDMAQGALRGSTGDFAGAAAEYSQASGGLDEMIQSFTQQSGGTPQQAGTALQDVNRQIGQMVAEGAQSEEFRNARASGGTTAGGGWLMALATALGEKLDVMADEIQDLAGAISKEDPSTTAKFGAATQEFSLLMNATNNALKTLGEALSSTARKG